MSNCDKLIGRVKDNKLRGYLDYNIISAEPTNLGPKTIISNGSYNPISDNLDGYNLVTVNVSPELEELQVTPTKQTQSFTSDLDGYSEVTVNPIPEQYIVPTGTLTIDENGIYDVTSKASVEVEIEEQPVMTIEKTITENGTYNASSEGAVGYDVVIVNVPNSGSTDISEYFNDTITTSSSSNQGWKQIIKKIPPIQIENTANSFFKDFFDTELSGIILGPTVTNIAYMFDGSALTTINFGNNFDTSNVTTMSYMFNGCKKLTTLNLGENFNTSNVTDMMSMFYNCENLLELDVSNFNTSSLTGSLQGMFYNCKKLTTLNLGENFNTSNVNYMHILFSGCNKLTTINFGNNFDTSNVTGMGSMFNGCNNLIDIPKLKANKVTNSAGFVSNCTSLTNFGGLENLGMAYDTTQSANYANYRLDLSSCRSLTHESLMNVINNLYDIATKGCNAQTLQLGTTNKAKLTEEEIAIATNKGWTVS